MKQFFQQLWLILSLDCEQSAHLTSESFDRPLTRAESVALTIHRLICAKSRRLNQQMIQLHRALQNVLAETEATPHPATELGVSANSSNHENLPIGLSRSAKARIQSRLQQLDSESL